MAGAFDKIVSITIYRLIQEAFNNALQACASQEGGGAIGSRKELPILPDTLLLSVEDDGLGFDFET